MSSSNNNDKDSSSSSSALSMRKHVFLFRHCVRSTDSYVNLHNTTDGIGSNEFITNFWSTISQSEVQIPDWNVPKYWCTENGMKQMQLTGAYVYNTMLQRRSNQKIKFRFLSDASQRDIDTSYALQQGISNAILADSNNNPDESLELSHLNVMEIVPNIFQPFKPTSISNNKMCNTTVTTEQWQQEVHDRFYYNNNKNTTPSTNNNHSSFVPPPTTSISDILRLLQVNAIWYNNSTMNLTTTTTVNTDTSKDQPVLTGMINVIKLVAQMMFYSRASGIVDQQEQKQSKFLYRITNEQLYAILIPYIYYTRSILNVGTTEAAIRGAVLVRTMIDSIQHNHNKRIMDDDDDNNKDDIDDDTATFLIGHDTDLDAVATAMGVSWQFHFLPLQNNTNDNGNDSYKDLRSSNYNNSLLWYMTPPGSAIYISSEKKKTSSSSGGGNNNNSDENDENVVVTMSYLVPIYDLESNDGSIITWQLVPLQFMNTKSYHYTNDVVDKAVTVNDNATTVNWMSLQQHIQAPLQQYNGATECYNSQAAITIINQEKSDTTKPSDSVDVTPFDKQLQPTGGTSLSFSSGFGCGLGVSILLMLALWYCFVYRCSKQQRLRSQYSKSSIQLSEYHNDGSRHNDEII